MLDIKKYLKQTKTVLVTQDAFDELVKKASAQPEVQSDGTLVIDTDKYSDVKRVLVQNGTDGTLYYADAEPQWIPCSITPPELGVEGNVLLYGKDRNYAVGWYDEDYFTWDDRFDTDTPIAWMPLPEPYKGES